MKKILSIALIAALIVGSAFAGFKKGEATIDLGYNLDSQAYGFTNGTSVKYNFGFVLGEENAEKAGEGDLRAEIAASFKAEFKAADYVGPTTETANIIKDAVVSTLKITKADIIYKDITFGILGAGKSADFAASYYDDNEDGDPDSDVITALSGVAGFTVKYANINGGFGLTGNAKTEDFALLSYATVKGLALAEGITADAAAAAKLTTVSGGDLKYEIQANGAFAYAKEAFSADAAVDFRLADKVALEVAANASYDFVSANVYFYGVDSFDTINLDAKVAASKAVTETVTVGGSVDARNVTADGREVKVAANVTAVVAPVKVEAEVGYAVFGKTVKTTTKVTYTAEKFSAYAKLVAGMKFADEFTMTTIAPEVGVSSDAIVSGATLSLGWTGAEFADGATKKANGKINAQVKISL